MSTRKRDSEQSVGGSVPRAGGGSWLSPGDQIVRPNYTKTMLIMRQLGTNDGVCLEPRQRALVVATALRWRGLDEQAQDLVLGTVLRGRHAYTAWIGPDDVWVIRHA